MASGSRGMSDTFRHLANQHRATRRTASYRLLVILFLSLCLLQPAQSQSQPVVPSFDGLWTANIPSHANCPASYLALQVHGNSFHGFMLGDSGAFRIVGFLDTRGNGTIVAESRTAFWIGINVVRLFGTVAFRQNSFLRTFVFSARYIRECGTEVAVGQKGLTPMGKAGVILLNVPPSPSSLMDAE
jgi:hypothetical protein